MDGADKFILFMICAFCFAFGLVAASFSNKFERGELAFELKTQCEQDLPRSEECVMTYVRGKE